jgi:enterochelin esterase-like enzyme
MLTRVFCASALLTLAVSGMAQTSNPRTPEAGKPEGLRQRWSGAAPKKWSEMPPGEWLDPDHDAPNGTQYQTFHSAVLGRDASCLVYLPADYEQQTKRYPVLYWLHGMGGNQRGGAMMFVPRVEAAAKEGLMPPVIIVLVNGMVKGFYCDAVDGKRPVESVIIKDLIPHVDKTYRTIARREGRLIEGYSMGGYGAAHLGFKYPELFGTVIVNAGALLDPDLPHATSGGPMQGVFGDNVERRKAEHPKYLVRQNADKLRGRTNIRIGCGSLDSLLPVNQQLHETLQQLGIEHQYEVVPDVAHNGALYYQKLGPKVFEFHRRSLEQLKPAQ